MNAHNFTLMQNSWVKLNFDDNKQNNFSRFLPQQDWFIDSPIRITYLYWPFTMFLHRQLLLASSQCIMWVFFLLLSLLTNTANFNNKSVIICLLTIGIKRWRFILFYSNILYVDAFIFIWICRLQFRWKCYQSLHWFKQ